MAKESLSSYQGSRGRSRRLSLSDDQTNLQESHIDKNPRCVRECPKDEDFPGTEGESQLQSHCCGLGDAEARKAKEAIAESLREIGIEVDPDSIVLGHLDTCGLPGPSFDYDAELIEGNHIQPLEPIETENLFHTMSPQTISDLLSHHSWFRQLYGDRFREQTDKSN